MKNINKLFSIIFVFFIGIFSVNANSLTNLNVNVTLNTDGSAHITERWTMYNSTDTEVYKKMYNLGNSSVTNFFVTMNDTKFDYINSWDIHEDFDYKKYKNGINYVSEGIELCWGISEYGNKTYIVDYDISNLIFNTSDAQILYYKFIDGMSIMNDMTYSITISGPSYYSDTLDVWGYGSKAYVYVSEGKIHASNEENSPMNGESDYMVILAKYNLGTFNTSNSYNQYATFDEVLSAANENTYEYDYSESKIAIILAALISILINAFPLIIFIMLIIKIVNKTNKYKFGEAGKKIKESEINMFRDIPCNKDIFRAYFIAQAYGLTKKKTDFIGSVFLKWIYNDNISILKSEKKVLFKNKEITSIELKKEPLIDIEKELYDITSKAAKDNVLEENEFEKYAKRSYNKVFGWFDNAEKHGRTLYINEGIVTKEKGKYLINDSLKEEAIKLAGLKKYLIHLSNINEKEALEVKLWKEYLMYAQIFGIADKVAKQFEKLYPEIITDMNDGGFTYADFYIINNMCTNTVHAASSARSAAQSYSSGGGGFSSGGGGGGSFGGGGGGTR